MWPIKQARLEYQEDDSTKFYDIDLLELANGKDERYLINFYYGEREWSRSFDTKTPEPIELGKAEKIFDSLVVSKLNDGYTQIETKDKSDRAPLPPLSTEAVQQLTQRILDSLDEEDDSEQRSRKIWRLGELGYGESSAIAKAIVAYAGKGEWFEEYSIAWTLGRIKAHEQKAVLESLCKNEYREISHIAFESLLLISDEASRTQLLADHWQHFPEPFKAAVMAGDSAAIDQQLRTALLLPPDDRDQQINQRLVLCYQLSLLYPALRQALLNQLAHIPVAAGYFRGIRTIYKMAELRLDAPVFGLLAQRFETTPSHFNGWEYMVSIPGKKGWFKPNDELGSDNSRLAFSRQTRAYFRRRIWRTLKRMGQVGDLRYVDMATEVLLAVNDEHGSEPRTSEVYRYTDRWTQMLYSIKEYGPFAGFLAFNHILFEHNPNYKLGRNSRAWINRPSIENDATHGNTKIRGECFPELWDQKPENALRLLKLSRCELVHPFARQVLERQPEFCQSISSSDLIDLLKSTYASTCEFALALVQERIQQGGVDSELLLALLGSVLAEARALGLQCLATFKSNNDFSLLAELLLIAHSDVQSGIKDYILKQSLFSYYAEKLLKALFDAVVASTDSVDEQHAETLAAFITENLNDALKALSIADVERLICDEHLPRNILGAYLLLEYPIDYGDIPDRLLQAIHDSSSEVVRGVGAALLGKQPDEALLQQLPLLADLYSKGDGPERQALLTIFSRLAHSADTAAGEVIDALLALSFKSEEQPGQHEELIAFFEKHKALVSANFDIDMLWRLLRAQSNCAQRVGALFLASRDADVFSVKQWAILGQHSDASVRKFVFNAYAQHIDIIKQNSRDALRLLNSDWDDTREFGFNFFREHYQKEDWNPDLIVFVCDSIRDDVQGFGREILQAFFDAGDGPEYLIKLSQHPSNKVQLFVSHFLADYATDNAERILSLQAYFTTVLSKVNQGRVCKDRVLPFLLKEAEKNTDVAAMVMPLLERISLTVVHRDKAALIKSMLKLQSLYPDMTPLLVARQVPVKQTS